MFNVSWHEEVTQGKPGVAGMDSVAACCSRETKRGLDTQPAAVLWSVCLGSGVMSRQSGIT